MTFRNAAPHRQRRAQACLLLATCADLVAAPLQGRALPDPAHVETLLRATPRYPVPGAAVNQLLVLAEHLGRHHGGVDDDDLAAALAEQWPTGRPELATTGTGRVLAAVAAGTPWWQAAPALHHGAGSYGSVAAVRAAAAGLLPGVSLAAVALVARRSADLTHTHPLAGDGAAATAVAVALAARDNPGSLVHRHQFLEAVAGQTRTAEFRTALRTVATLVRHRSTPTETAATLGTDRTALRSVPAALTAFLRHYDDPAAAIRYALLMGGHTRTVAAITGALAGARRPDHPVTNLWLPDTSWQLRIQAAATALSTAVASGTDTSEGRP